jgi:hypothetical protein
MPMERMQILVTSEQREWLERESSRRGQPCTAVIRDALDAARGHRPTSQRMAAFARLAALPVAPSVSVHDIESALASRYRDVPR